MPFMLEVTIQVGGEPFTLRIPVERGETLNEFGYEGNENSEGTTESADAIYDNEALMGDTSSYMNAEPSTAPNPDDDLGSFNLDFNASSRQGSVDHNTAPTIGIDDSEPNPPSGFEETVGVVEHSIPDVEIPIISFDPNVADLNSNPWGADEEEEEAVDDTIVGRPEELDTPVVVKVADSSTAQKPLDLSHLEETTVELDDLDDPSAIEGIDRVADIAMNARSVSSAPQVTPPSLKIQKRDNPQTQQITAEIMDSITGDNASIPEFIPVEDDEDPDEVNPDAPKPPAKGKMALQAGVAVLVFLALIAGVVYAFVGGGGSSTPTSAKKPAKTVTTSVKPTTTTKSPTSTATSGSATAEFARFCQAARSWPGIAISSTTTPTQMQQSFTNAATAITNMVHNTSNPSTIHLLSGIATTDGALALIMSKAGWSLSKVPSSEYPTLQGDASTLNGQIAQLNTVTKTC